MIRRLRASLHLVVVTLSLGACVAMLLGTSSAADAYTSPLIWVGSPVNGTWGVDKPKPDWSTTPGGGHHKLGKANPQNDWAGDLPTASGNAVYLYAAPSNSTYNNAVTARIEQIVDDNACLYGGGGDFVTVGIYYNGTRYGRVTYAHIDRDPSLYVGKSIPRWGTSLGTVAYLTDATRGGDNCWTGPHVHFEMRAETNYACWNKGYTYAGYPVNTTNFLGFVSGPLTSYATTCP